MRSVDVLIIAALKDEYDAAKAVGLVPMSDGAVIVEWRDRDPDGTGLTPYVLGDYVAVDGRRLLSVALARPTHMGGRQTSPLATTLTNRLQPTCLAMCGVCAGNPDDTSPGDVVVAALAYEYDEGKIVGSAFRGDHRQYPQDNRWVRAAQDFVCDDLRSYGAATSDEASLWFLERLHMGQNPRIHPARERFFPPGTWQLRLEDLESQRLIRRHDCEWALTQAGTRRVRQALYDDVDGPERLPFAVHSAPMASGSSVVEHPMIWNRLASMGGRKVLALEMEAATIATVADERKVPHWLVAKGVVDSADLTKNDRVRRFATQASAEVLYSLLLRLLAGDPPRPDCRGRSAPSTGPESFTPRTSIRPSGRLKVEVLRRLYYDWQDLADLVGVPLFERARFAAGNEPRGLWEWLENRCRLSELPDALDEIGHSDLAERLRGEVEF